MDNPNRRRGSDLQLDDPQKRWMGNYTYGLTDYWCPYCGYKELWQRVDDRDGDFYLGIQTFCNACRTIIHNLEYGLDQRP